MGQMSDQPIAYEAILAYSELYGIPIMPHEVDAVKRLDLAWMKVRNA